MAPDSHRHRRRFIQLIGTGAVAALAGCAGNGEETPTASPSPTGTSSPTSTPEPVPEEYRTATSQGGDDRNPDALQTKAAVQYQDSPSDGDRCADCRFYIQDMNGDGMGACAIVEGTISPDGWCSSFTATDSS